MCFVHTLSSSKVRPCILFTIASKTRASWLPCSAIIVPSAVSLHKSCSCCSNLTIWALEILRGAKGRVLHYAKQEKRGLPVQLVGRPNLTEKTAKWALMCLQLSSVSPSLVKWELALPDSRMRRPFWPSWRKEQRVTRRWLDSFSG